MTIANHWLSDTAYASFRRRFAEEGEPAPAPPVTIRQALLNWAAAHDGIVHVTEVAAALDVSRHVIRKGLSNLGAVRVGPGQYRPGEPKPAPKRPQPLMDALRAYAASHEGYIDPEVIAAERGVTEGCVRGACQRLGAKATGVPHFYSLYRLEES